MEPDGPDITPAGPKPGEAKPDAESAIFDAHCETQSVVVKAPVADVYARFLFCLPCNYLFERTLNRIQISRKWLQAHFEIVEDRLLVRFGRGDFLELHGAHHDLFAADRRQSLDHVAHCPLSIFCGCRRRRIEVQDGGEGATASNRQACRGTRGF